MKPMNLVLVTLLLLSVVMFTSGERRVLARQDSGAVQMAGKLPPDIHPETLSRMPQAHRDEFTSDEDKQAYDHLISVESRFGKPSNGALGGTGTRLHLPVVADAYRTAWNNLRDKSGVEQKYMELATIVACRETNLDLEWVAHQDITAKLNSPEVVEIVRNKKDPKGLEEKQRIIIEFGREMFERPKVSSATFANMEKSFGQRGTLAIALMMGYYANNAFLFRAYDQRMDPGKENPFPDVKTTQERKALRVPAVGQ
jgi:4-carboxymuconolactone decarboxylase